jgi:cyclase
MRRGLVLAALLVAAVLSQGAMWLGCSPPAASPSKTATIERITDNLYVIVGGGGNTAVFVTDAGVVVVDTKLAGWGPVILEKIRTVTDKPVTTIINTHTHNDHVGSNAFFRTAVEIVAHANTKSHMQVRQDFFEAEGSAGTPNKTFADKMSLMSGADRIDLYYFGAGHTDGDAVVVFPAARTAHAGDLFEGKGAPVIDGVHGGSGVAYPETLSKMFAGIDDVDTIITGHGAVMTWSDLEDFADFNRAFLAWAVEQMRTGKSPEDAAAAYKLPEKYKGYAAAPWQVKPNIEWIYKELQKPTTPPRPWRGGVR